MLARGQEIFAVFDNFATGRVRPGLFETLTSRPHRLFHRQVAETQAVIQPVGQKAVHLHLFIGVMHKPVRVVVHRRDLSLPVTADHFSHHCVVVDPHRRLRIIQPAAAVVDLLQQQGFGELCRLQYFNPNPPEVLVLPVQFKLAHRLAIGFQLPQFAEPLIIAITQRTQLAQIRHIPLGPFYPLGHANHSLRSLSRFSCSHWIAMIAAALLMRPSAIMAKHSSALTTWLRMSSCSCSTPKIPPASAVLTWPQYRWIISVVPPGETR